MASSCMLMDLPELVLYNICSFITCPFDLLHFGNTCSRLRKISSSSSLWWSIALRWFRGLWILMEEGSTEENSREWLLDIMRQYAFKPRGTKYECCFSNYEDWKRVDSPKFRFLVNLLRVAYAKDKDEHPAVLFEQWLFDIGVYQRSGTCFDYSAPNLEFSKIMVSQLSSLGQASERDLCRRKQPYKDSRYYIKQIASSETSWMSDLFPSSHCVSICPLLLCPFQESATNEVSGIQGLAMCLSVVFEKRLKSNFKASTMPLQRVWEIVKVFCTVFVSEMLPIIPELESRLGTMSLRSAVLTVVEENSYDFKQLQMILDYSSLNLKSKEIVFDLYHLLKQYQGIDFAVDEIRLHLREAINAEIEKVLFPPCSSSNTVTRINLTDSDLIGGDNSKQEMSAAAFVSNNGVLVTWHLTGRMRY